MALVEANLRTATFYGADAPAARNAMAFAAMMAMFGRVNGGKAAIHALAYGVQSRFDIPHGEASRPSSWRYLNTTFRLQFRRTRHSEPSYTAPMATPGAGRRRSCRASGGSGPTSDWTRGSVSSGPPKTILTTSPRWLSPRSDTSKPIRGRSQRTAPGRSSKGSPDRRGSLAGRTGFDSISAVRTRSAGARRRDSRRRGSGFSIR